MTYVHGNPVSGFTLELDGDTAAIEAIINAAMKELGRQFEIAEREEDRIMKGGLPVRSSFVFPARRPVQGVLQVRTRE